MLLSADCPICGRPGGAPCAACASTLPAAPPLPPPPDVDRCLALLSFEGPAADLVAGLKYRNQRAPLAGLGRAMADRAQAAGGGVASTVTWIPTTPAHRRDRGFDQAQLLARHVASALRLPLARLLVRDPGPPQTGRRRVERLAGPRMRPVRRASGLVLAVDDVVTTGATTSAAAASLRRAGADEVWVLAAARRGPQAHHGA